MHYILENPCGPIRDAFQGAPGVAYIRSSILPIGNKKYYSG